MDNMYMRHFEEDIGASEVLDEPTDELRWPSGAGLCVHKRIVLCPHWWTNFKYPASKFNTPFQVKPLVLIRIDHLLSYPGLDMSLELNLNVVSYFYRKDLSWNTSPLSILEYSITYM